MKPNQSSYSKCNTLLDCTLRDGGYYTKWDFSRDLVSDYIEVMTLCQVDYIELGYRSRENKYYSGPHRYTSERFLDSLLLSRKDYPRIAVMVDAKEFITSGSQAVRKLFCTAGNSYLSLVRIAASLDTLDISLQLAESLKSLGYRVAVNIMGIFAIDKDLLAQSVERIEKEETVDIVYLADSTGSMRRKNIDNICGELVNQRRIEMGIHAHDNLGLAVENTIEAIEQGFKWCDATILGMGRGAGNASTELLLQRLKRVEGIEDGYIRLLELIENYFKSLLKEHQWGSSPFYYMCGLNGVKAGFVSEMNSNYRYSVKDIFLNTQTRCERLSKPGENSLRSTNIEFNPRDVFEGNNVLLVGPGISLRGLASEIKRFSEERATVNVALNINSNIDENLIDYRIGLHPLRLASDIYSHRSLQTPLITAVSLMDELQVRKLVPHKTYNFACKIREGQYCVESSCPILPYPSTLLYAVSLFATGKAKRIYLAGFDGYGLTKDDLSKTSKELSIFQQSSASVPLVSITPCPYPIESESIYFEQAEYD